MIHDSIEPPGSTPISSIRLDSSWPRSVDRGDRQHLYSYLEERFGIPARTFDRYLIFKRQKSWWLLRNTPLLERMTHLKVSIIGLRAFNQVREYIKPTTRFIQVFGSLATKRIHPIDGIQLEALLRGETLTGAAEEPDGYIIFSFKDRPIGLGLLIKGRIQSQLPRKDFLFIKH